LGPGRLRQIEPLRAMFALEEKAQQKTRQCRGDSWVASRERETTSGGARGATGEDWAQSPRTPSHPPGMACCPIRVPGFARGFPPYPHCSTTSKGDWHVPDGLSGLTAVEVGGNIDVRARQTPAFQVVTTHDPRGSCS